MAVETEYYEILGVEVDATEAELRKAYRKQAIRLHPDKNGNDPKAAEKFQDLGEAYGVLSNAESRKLYDQYGKERMKNNGGVGGPDGEADIDPSEFFEMVFGGSVAFRDWIGKLGMMDDLTKSAEVLSMDDDEEGEEGEAAAAAAAKAATTTTTVNETEESGARNESRGGKEKLLGHGGSAFTSTSPTDASVDTSMLSLTLADRNDSGVHKNNTRKPLEEYRKKSTKHKITKEQRDEVMRIQEESREAKIKRINELTEKLLGRIEAYRTASMNPDGTRNYTEKLKVELDDMKVESFGIQLTHLIGKIYTNKAKAAIQASKTLGFSKIYTSVKSSGETMRNGISIVKSALDTQEAMERFQADQEEFQIKLELGYEPTPEELGAQIEKERYVTGKFLATAWTLVKFEVTGVLNKVCQNILNEKGLGRKERLARAHALLFLGKELSSVQRSAEEDDEARIFEEMMADAKIKKDKKHEAEKSKHHFFVRN